MSERDHLSRQVDNQSEQSNSARIFTYKAKNPLLALGFSNQPTFSDPQYDNSQSMFIAAGSYMAG